MVNIYIWKQFNNCSIFIFSYTGDDIERKVSVFRKMLMDKEGVTESGVELDESGRPL